MHVAAVVSDSKGQVQNKLVIVTLIIFIDNEVDGEAFLLLPDQQIISMVKAIGAQLKLIKKRDSLNHQVCCGDYFGTYMTINIDIFPNKNLTAPQLQVAISPQKRVLTNDSSDAISSSEVYDFMHHIITSCILSY